MAPLNNFAHSHEIRSFNNFPIKAVEPRKPKSFWNVFYREGGD